MRGDIGSSRGDPPGSVPRRTPPASRGGDCKQRDREGDLRLIDLDRYPGLGLGRALARTPAGLGSFGRDR